MPPPFISLIEGVNECNEVKSIRVPTTGIGVSFGIYAMSDSIIYLPYLLHLNMNLS